MTKNKIDIIFDTMIERITLCCSPEKVLLFGSYARGDATEDSDIDLLIILDVPKESKRKWKQKLYYNLAGLGVSKDIIIATPGEVDKYKDITGTVLFPALREGKVLYEKVS